MTTRYTGMFRLFPIPGTSEDGFVDNDVNLIKRSVLNIIKTHKGSRVYDPDYGTNVHLLIHEQNINRTRNIAKMEIENAIKKYEPRAKLLAVNAYAGKDDKAHEAVVVLKVQYVEFDITEDLEIRLETEQDWIREEGVPPNPMKGRM